MKRILVALDGSARARDVLDTAARLATLTGAKLVLFRAVSVPLDVPPEAFVSRDSRLEDVLRSRARMDLEQLGAAVDKQLIEQLVVELATPWDGICRAARERDVDLVVLGSHGYNVLDRLLGTTAAKVVNHVDRDVFVVRTPTRRE